ncbi:phosphate ABC transporter permease subunit PstC [Prosthecomicrobium hirschii]|uniref:phosphate ABC transporter permease subunit PstC n=1 Tax=Prosthecodimorpha hirschii TaxID=665126 RepID=UPI00112606AE|nr:phosphate ABC transporter permease subunit PstC [Prosthecomicrobium hirschii]TPQ49734.1 phosphate ABC transporter permease subunit PstC [Prosthecomicrobium hirschii]
MSTVYLAILAAAALVAFLAGRGRVVAMQVAGGPKFHSLPGYHGWWVAIAVAAPMIGLFALWSPLAPIAIEHSVLASLPPSLQPADDLARATLLREIHNVAAGSFAGEPRPEIAAAAGHLTTWTTLADWGRLIVGLLLGALGARYALQQIQPAFRSRTLVERVVLWIMIGCSTVAILTTVGIVSSVLFESLRFFARYSWFDFLFGLQWSPQTAIRADQVGQSGAFGAVPLFAGTALIMLIAMCVAVPIGLFSAIYMAEYASPRVRAVAKPVLEVLAGVPTVVYGFFAALTMAPMIREAGHAVGLQVASESALAAGLVMGVMIIPFVSSLSDDIINAVPQALRDGSYAMGATKSETIRKVVLPAALPGIVSAVMLAVSRAVGETMIVVMAAGLSANLTFNPLEAVTTVTVQIKTLLVGDQEFDSAKTLSAFALGFVLFFFTLALNVIALRVVQKYREQYD